VSGRALAVGTLPAGVDRERFAARLVAAVRPEFAAEVIVPASGDVVLGTPACAVPDCGRASSRQGWCQAHFRRWDKVGRPERQAWAAAADSQTWGHRRLAGCRAPGCRFSQHRDRLCYRHSQDWRRDGQPEIHAWLAACQRQPKTDQLAASEN